MATTTASSTTSTADTRDIAVDELFFDDRNPRIQELDADASQEEILRVLWRDFAVDEVALSVAANGFFRYEPLFAHEESQGVWRVIEGNRRLAAVKLLLSPKLRRLVGATDLPEIDSKVRQQLDSLPVVPVSRSDLWQYLGFRHINGPQVWQSYSKAKYIAWVHNELSIPLDGIAKHIGDQHATVKRLYRGLMTLDQAEDNGVFYLNDRWKNHFSFSHLYTGLDYKNVQTFIALDPENSFEPNPVPETKVKELGELCEWLYGSKTRGRKPVVQSQNPDLRNLDFVLASEDGVAALRRGLPLRVSIEIGKGDESLFREQLVSAKQSLQEARGKLLTGYDGEPSLLSIADDILQLAESIHEEMSDLRRKRKRSSSGRGATGKR